GRCRRLWESALREAPRQRKVAKLVEIENLACEAERAFADLRRLPCAVRGEVTVEFGFERREISIEQIEDRDPVLVFLESRTRRQRHQKVGVERAMDVSLRPRALFESVRRQACEIFDDGDTVMTNSDTAATGRIEIQIQPDLLVGRSRKRQFANVRQEARQPDAGWHDGESRDAG